MKPVRISYSRVPMKNGICKITITSLKRGVVYKTVRNLWRCEETNGVIVSSDEKDTSKGFIVCEDHEDARNVIRDAHIAAYHLKEVKNFWKYQNINS